MSWTSPRTSNPKSSSPKSSSPKSSNPKSSNPKRQPRDDPTPEPGITAPLDDLTEEEKKSGPMGVMPGAGPDADEIRHSGVEEQEEREEQKEADGEAS